MSMVAEHHPVEQLYSVPHDTPTFRKRRAGTPPEETKAYGAIHLNWMPGSGELPESPTRDATPHRQKRRRPNLANGLMGLSLAPRSDLGPEPLPSYDESEETRNEVDEDDMFESHLNVAGDLQVEELPDSSRRRRNFLRASSTDSSDAESRDSEDHYTFLPRLNRDRHPRNQQPDSVEQPSPTEERPSDLDIQDVTAGEPRGTKRRDDIPQPRTKRRRDDMDLDMETEDEDEREHRKWRKNATSYEPEKDRIVVTSLSDTESEASISGSATPQEHSDLNQPGSQGFTLSPSLLTHLLNSQREHFSVPHKSQEKGLILYRPLGIPPGPQIVQQWPAPESNQQYDSSRFEELDEDEDTGMGMAENDSGNMEIDMEEPMQLD